MKGLLLPAIAVASISSAFSQATVGIWDLRPWVYDGTSILTTTIDSTGPKVSGLSATSTSSTSISLTGNDDGLVTSAQDILLVNGSPQTETLDQKFSLDKSVNFGPLHTQSQFNAEPGNNNGVGVAVTIPDYALVTGYTLTLKLEGGGTFKSVDGTFFDAPVIAFVDNRTVTLTWTTLTAATIIVDKVKVAGAIQSFEASHSWSYLNGTGEDVQTQNAVSMIISNAPPEPPVVKVDGGNVLHTNKRHLRLRGSCSDYNDDIRYVEVKLPGKGYRRARGLDKWRFVARGLRDGNNHVKVRAVDSTGSKSRPDRVTIVCNS